MTPADRRWAMLGLVAAAVVVLVVVAVGALLAVVAWEALKPFRMAAVDLWELIPAGARHEVAIGLAVAGWVLLVLFAVVGYRLKAAPEPRSRGRARRRSRVGFDEEIADIDDSAL